MSSLPNERDRHPESACARLVARYARAVDLNDGVAAAACFTIDGLLEMPLARRYQGRDEIARRIDEQPDKQVSRHLLSNLLIDPIAPDRARGSLYLTIYRGVRLQPAGALELAGPYLVGEYDDEYVLNAEGWLIARRRLTTIFRRAEAAGR